MILYSFLPHQYIGREVDMFNEFLNLVQKAKKAKKTKSKKKSQKARARANIDLGCVTGP